jgi:hypothetical protein
MRTPVRSRSAWGRAAGAAIALTAACGDLPALEEADASRTRRDAAGPDAIAPEDTGLGTPDTGTETMDAGLATLDTGTGTPDAGVIATDASVMDVGLGIDGWVGPSEDSGQDAFVPSISDGGPRARLECVHRHALGEDLFLLARDSDTSVPSFATVATTAGLLVAVYSTTSAGTRALEVFQVRTSGADAGPLPPETLPETEGGSLPTLVSGPDGFWLSFVQGGQLRVARFDESFTALGSPSTVASASPSTPPRLARTSTGGYLVWTSGSEIRGRALDESGAPAGLEHVLVSAGRAVQQVALERVGAGDALALSWANGGAPRVARLDPSSGTTGAASDVAGDPGIFSSLDLAGASRPATPGATPLAGAAVYDVDDLGFRDVVFRVVSEMGGPALSVAAIAAGGEQAWGATVEPYLSGYAVAYRARVPRVERPVLRVGYLDEESCAVGAVLDSFTLGTLGSETGAPAALGVDGDTMMIAWSERQDLYVDYVVATLTCTERR